jgi:hypothetical protein
MTDFDAVEVQVSLPIEDWARLEKIVKFTYRPQDERILNEIKRAAEKPTLPGYMAARGVALLREDSERPDELEPLVDANGKFTRSPTREEERLLGLTPGSGAFSLHVDYGEQRPGSSKPMPPERRAEYQKRIEDASKSGPGSKGAEIFVQDTEHEREQRVSDTGPEADVDEAEYQATRARVIAGKASIQEAQDFIDFLEGAIPMPVRDTEQEPEPQSVEAGEVAMCDCGHDADRHGNVDVEGTRGADGCVTPCSECSCIDFRPIEHEPSGDEPDTHPDCAVCGAPWSYPAAGPCPEHPVEQPQEDKLRWTIESVPSYMGDVYLLPDGPRFGERGDRITVVPESELREALDLLERLLGSSARSPITRASIATLDEARGFLRKHGHLTEGER